MFKILTSTHRRYLKITKKVLRPYKNFNCNLKHQIYPYLYIYIIVAKLLFVIIKT